jgi:hypothetical protein
MDLIVRVRELADEAAAIRHAGRADRATGTEGDRVADKVQAAESEDARGHRDWLAADGTVANAEATAYAGPPWLRRDASVRLGP